MRARLRLDHEGITVLLAASVEEYLRASGAVYSWQGPIREYDQHRGLLILDDDIEPAAEHVGVEHS